MHVISLLLSALAQDSVVIVGLYNTSTWAGHPAETNSYQEPSVHGFSLGADGAMSRFGRLPAGLNVSWITGHPTRRDIFYAVNEVAEFDGATSGSVTTLRFSRTARDFEVLARATSGGAGPVFATVDATGRWLLVANYGGGTLAVLRIRDSDGTVDGTDARTYFEGAGAHSVYLDPVNGQFVLSPSLGEDLIAQWSLHPSNGSLTPNPSAPSLALPEGSGPRHLAFHPTAASMVVVADEGGAQSPVRLTVCRFDGQRGVLTALASVSALPEGADPTDLSPAEVLFAPDGRFVYISIRDATDAGRDAVAVLRVLSTAPPAVELVGSTPTGHYPRSMALDPSGRLLLVANQKGGTVTSFARDEATGQLKPTGHAVALPDAPAFVTVL